MLVFVSVISATEQKEKKKKNGVFSHFDKYICAA